MAAGFAALSTGRADVPMRSFFPVAGQDGTLLLMPGAMRDETGTAEQLAVKLVSVFNRNPTRGLPLIYGLVTLFEATTGRPLALLDGATVTAIRTGAASGVATQYLAARGAKRLALFGTGVQAQTQLEAIRAARANTLQEVLVVGRDSAKTRTFAEQMATRTGLIVRPAENAQEALAHAEIIATATSSHIPVFEDSQLASGAHINGVGSYQATMREVPGATVVRARVVVDAREAALSEAGDLIIPIQEGSFGPEHIYAELGEVVDGRRAGRESFEEGEISFFKSVGNAVQDVAFASYIYQKARALGIGTEVEL